MTGNDTGRAGEACSGESAQPFGDWVKSIIRAGLARHGRTQAEMARALGLSEKHVSQVLTGRASGSLDTVNAMLEYADPDHSGYGRPLPASPYGTPPAAGRGDTDSDGECQQSDWCGPGSHCLCHPAARPAGDRAQPMQEQSTDLTPGVVWTDAQLAVVRDLTARAFRAEAAVGRVEALLPRIEGVMEFDMAGERYDAVTSVQQVLAHLRRALDGTT